MVIIQNKYRILFQPQVVCRRLCIIREYNPLENTEIYVAKEQKEKAMQEHCLRYKNPKNRGVSVTGSTKAGRLDLIDDNPLSV